MNKLTQTEINRRKIRKNIEQTIEVLYGAFAFLLIIATYWMLTMLPQHAYKFSH